MHIAITAATNSEISAFYKSCNNSTVRSCSKLTFHETGVGMMAATFSITKLIYESKPDLIIQAGIAGAFDTNMELGKVVVVKDEIQGDTGVEENGEWRDLFDLNLEKKDTFPFEHKRLTNYFLQQYNPSQLPEVSAITVNEITTSPGRIALLRNKYAPDIESMEGAALHFVCKKKELPFVQLRAISNYVGERDKSKWLLASSVDTLNKTLADMILVFANQA